jgi:hypothetical protein
MATRERWYWCLGCGRLTYRRWRNDKPPICLECGIRRSILGLGMKGIVHRIKEEVRARQAAERAQV